MQSYNIDGINVLPPLLADYRLDPVLNIKHTCIPCEQGYTFEYHNFLKSVKDTTFNKNSNFYLTNQHGLDDIIHIDPLPDTYPIKHTSFLAFNRIYSDPLSSVSVTSDCFTGLSATNNHMHTQTTTGTSTTGSGTTGTETTGTTAATGQDLGEAVYIKVSNNSGTTSDTNSSRRITAGPFRDVKTQQTLEQEYYFNIWLIDGYNCIIFHSVNGRRLYLSINEDDSEPELEFRYVQHDAGTENIVEQILADAPGDSGKNIKFQYTFYKEKNLIRLYKTLNDRLHIINLLSDEEQQIRPNVAPVQLVPVVSVDNDNNPGTGGPNMLEMTQDTTLRMRPRQQSINEQGLSSRIHNYIHTINHDKVDVDVNRTTANLKTNNIVHTEYYFLTGTSLPINIMPLKNHETPSGNVLPTNKWDENDKYSQKRYNKLFTGTNQLDGTDKIYIDHTQNAHDITFKPGFNYFNYPQKPDPVIKLNINDSNLIDCGAIASNTPASSDKVFKKQAGYGNITRWGNPTDEHTGTWLCAWLSASNDPDEPPVWMDRYYNPETTGGIAALTTTTYLNNTFSTSEDSKYFSANQEVIDIVSSLTFEPGCYYSYHRVSENDLNNSLAELESNHIQKGFDSLKFTTGQSITYNNDEVLYDSSKYSTLTGMVQQNNIQDVSICFDMDIRNRDKPIGHMLLGNYTDSGFGVFNVNDVSPFIFLKSADGEPVNNIRQNSSIRIYDNNFKLINYFTNNSFIDSNETPSLFSHIVIREMSDNVYCFMESGLIVEVSFDGNILRTYDFWINKYKDNQDSSIVDVAYDERYVYILTNTGDKREDYTIDQLDMFNQTYTQFTDEKCIVNIPLPEFLKNNSAFYNYGRQITKTTLPPNKIYVKDDREPYTEHRYIYLGYGDEVLANDKDIWFKINGEIDATAQTQVKHDVLYGYDTYKLELLPGVITDNGLGNATTTPLTIIDQAVDYHGNIIIAHSNNYVTKISPSRKTLVSTILEEREILSILITRDLESGDIVERLNVMTKTIGDAELSWQIGPVLHPTNDPGSIDFRKASPWIDYTGKVYNREPVISPEDFDDTSSIIYPFVDGDNRFGVHTNVLQEIPSADPAGRVLNDDYTFATETLDTIVNETPDIITSTVFDLKSLEEVQQINLENFTVDDINNKPKLYNHYNYSKHNYNKYAKNNLNFKISLKSLHEQEVSDVINFKIDLDSISDNPYTNHHTYVINISNKYGHVKVSVDGITNDNLTFTFDPEKYRFNDIFKQKIIVGTTPYLRDILLIDKIKRPNSYVVRDVNIKNINIYTTTMDYHQQLTYIRSKNEVIPMHWSVPTGLRNYIEGVDRVFNHSIPPKKSNIYDINIRNSGIQSTQLQRYLENKVRNILPEISPGSTGVRNISWTNELNVNQE